VAPHAAPDLGHSRVVAPRSIAGSLTLVGTGIAAGLHLTAEARRELERADEVLYLGSEPILDAWLAGLNANTRPLVGTYEEGVPRGTIYARMVEEILAPVRAGRRVCVAFYGHPGFLVQPGHGALKQARAEGLAARMLPAVSALDCLIADLGVDPADDGLQTYEATEFLLRARRPDTGTALVLWQLSVIGVDIWSDDVDASRLPILVEVLEGLYGRDHEVVLYEASPYPVSGPSIERLPLHRLPEASISPMASLFVPPRERAPRDPEMARRLGLAPG
jgi:uncharacterized protein YabN with tetrapyrrole methylase and pyrophosphatase domain